MFSLGILVLFTSCVVQSCHGSEIIGGKEVVPHSLPFMALLENHPKMCGGILIDPQWVLTAAHCAEMKQVWLGVHSIKKKGKGSTQVIQVESNNPYPRYVAAQKGNDLMLLKLKKRAKITKTVKPLPLGNTVSEPKAGKTCVVAGWGKTSQNKRVSSDVLMSVNVTVIDRAKCNSHQYYNRKPVITKDMICAGSDGKRVADTCQGDSGGPLLCNGALVGITSFGKTCGDIMKPGVYSFISKDHLAWIKKKMNAPDM